MGTNSFCFTDVRTKVCIENTHSVHEPLKLMRRYGFKRCLDLEHLQMKCAGGSEAFMPVIRNAAHIHLTGYLWFRFMAYAYTVTKHSWNIFEFIGQRWIFRVCSLGGKNFTPDIW